MVKICSRRRVGVQQVYDIGVAKDHNFLLKTGLVASNCFNKSHSMAYGYVTYQTAYLKANYPVEYMAALLTANSGNQDKVQKYIATCMSMNITVQPPDVNHSNVDFTPVEGQKILFGLSAVRNLGQGAIDCILRAREEGPFESLAQLCDRVDLHAVNRRALEALVQCGALDRFNPNRKQLMEHLPLVIDWAQSRAKERSVGQFNLFDQLGDETQTNVDDNGFDGVPQAPQVQDYQPMEKLKLEKELLGFYVSDHPLKPIQKTGRLLAPVNLNEMEDQHEKVMVSAIVMLSSLKPIVTKKGDRMAIIQLEDLTGQVEAVVFPRTYERVHHHLIEDARLIVWGKVDRRDDSVQLIVEDAEPIERVQMVLVKLNPEQAGDIQQRHQLRDVLRSQVPEDSKPKVPVIGVIAAGHQRQLVRLGHQFQVMDCDQAVAALNRAGYPARRHSLAKG
ncbi:MAG: OB-fold nucleic acid binding domain-containing protein [Phormidium sp.]